jgi:hypothetical protein
LLLGAFLAACASSGGLPARLVDLPGSDPRLDPRVAAARAQFERGETAAALAVVADVLAEAPAHVDAHRLRQDALRQRGRLGLLLAEAEQRLERTPDDAAAHYLMGRVAADDAAKRRCFERATRLAPQSLWGWLGTAFVLRATDPARALRLYERLYDLSGRHETVAVSYAAALRAARQDDRAIEVYETLRASAPTRGIGELGLAESWFGSDTRVRAWEPPLAKALELRPFDPGVRSLVQRAAARWGEADLQQMLDILRRDADRLRQFCRDEGVHVLASLFAQAGDPFAARGVLAEHGEREPMQAAARRLARQLLLRTGDLRGFLAALRAAHPIDLLADETNKVRGLWVTILQGPWMAAADPLAEPAAAAALVHALLQAGLLEEADTVGTMALLRHDLPALRAHRDEARREVAFQRAVRRVVYHGYAVADGSGRDLEATLEEIRRISIEFLGTDVVGAPRLFKVPFVGTLVDPFAPGLGAHFARYNRHLVLGQRSGGPVEAMLLTRLSVRDLPQEGPLPLAGPCQEVIGEDRAIRPLSGVLGGDLAGVALLNHYVIDLDAVFEWAAGLRERRRIVRADGDALLRDPLPSGRDELDPAGVDWRLTALSPVQDSELDAAVLDMVRWHERAHLVDSFHFLPVESNFWRVLGLILRNGLRPSAVEADLEGRAETAALALSPHTELVLAHVAVFLASDSEGSPHARGFRGLARRLIAELRASGAAAPQASHWGGLDPAQVRAIARRLLDRQW